MNIIVNGGTRGIGKEIVMLLAKDKKNRILVMGRTASALTRLSSGAKNRNLSTFMTDLAVFDKNQQAFLKAVTSVMKNVDILINTAGSLVVKEFMKFSNDKAREMMETNFFGPASVIRAVQPLMKKGSHIVNISSMGGFQGSSKYKGLSYYSASKAALSCLTECLAEELLETGIAVNCLAIGSVQTEMFESAFPGFKAPLSPVEMADFISYFALNGNRFFNGKILPVAVNNP